MKTLFSSIPNEEQALVSQENINLQNKYKFQLQQNTCLAQQNKQLQHHLEILQAVIDNRIVEHQQSIAVLIQLIQSPISLCHKLTSEDWRQLFNCMNVLYGNKLELWLTQFHNLSKEEIALCYFCHIEIKHTNLAIFFSISPQSLSKRKQRLKNKLINQQPLEIKSIFHFLRL